jgi:hypothetical protein
MDEWPEIGAAATNRHVANLPLANTNAHDHIS